VGKEATLDNFKTLLGNINLIHLATHAVLDSEHPELSYIKFANNQKWQYKDIMSFNIKDIDSIVLSACSTAVKPSSNGSEIESMAYQLLRKSPSGSIVASFWDVDDGATAAFMQEYYQHIVNSIKKNGTLDRGGALRKAQLKLLRNKETSSPKYWAAFTLFGDFR
jgi:CHAT domain-containing protein